jgi:hypothetical protein
VTARTAQGATEAARAWGTFLSRLVAEEIETEEILIAALAGAQLG